MLVVEIRGCLWWKSEGVSGGNQRVLVVEVQRVLVVEMRRY